MLQTLHREDVHASPLGREWFICIAKQNQDHLVARGLREQNYPVYLPKIYRREKVGGSTRPVPALRLSPYVFVMFSPDPHLGEAGPIKNTRGVDRLLCTSEGKPRPLPHGHETIEFLRTLEDEELSEAAKSVKKGRTDIRAGDIVRVDRQNSFHHGKEGQVISLQRGDAWVFLDWARYRIPDVDLTLIRTGAS